MNAMNLKDKLGNVVSQIKQYTQKDSSVTYVSTEDAPLWLRKYIYTIRPLFLMVTEALLAVTLLFVKEDPDEYLIISLILIAIYMQLCQVTSLPNWSKAKEAFRDYMRKETLVSKDSNDCTVREYFFEAPFDEIKEDLVMTNQIKLLLNTPAKYNGVIPQFTRVTKYPNGAQRVEKYYYLYNQDVVRSEVVKIVSNKLDFWQRVALIKTEVDEEIEEEKRKAKQNG